MVLFCSKTNCYSHGQGVEKNQSKAAQFYQKAAEKGHRDAQFELGSCYEEGQSRGVKKNYKEAAKWYRKAADQGHEGAKECLKKFRFKIFF